MRRAKYLLAATMMIPAIGNAAQYTCDGHAEVATGRGSELYLKVFSGSQWVALCSMTQVVNGISIDACRNAYAMLLGAQLANRRVRIWFNDQLTCSTQQPWSYAAWSFGPELLGE